MSRITCGIDWAADHHDIALVDADGQVVAKRRIPESVTGFAELTAMFADAGEDPEDPIPVAIETPRGLLVAALRATGRPVYPINPMAVARYRERTSMSRKKSDHADAVTLANILRTDAHAHRRLPADTNWHSRSRCSPAPIRTPPGDAAAPVTNYARCCASTTRASCTPSPTDPRGSPHQRLAQCLRSHPHPPRRRGCRNRRSSPPGTPTADPRSPGNSDRVRCCTGSLFIIPSLRHVKLPRLASDHHPGTAGRDGSPRALGRSSAAVGTAAAAPGLPDATRPGEGPRQASRRPP